MLKEIQIPGVVFNLKYRINEDGEVYSPSTKPMRKLHSHPTKKGYHRISLQTDLGQKTFQLHRLVLMTFKPIDNMKNLEVNHIDGDKNNNKLSNLEWCTGSFNVRHCLDNGLKIPARGEKVAGNKLSETQVLEICERLKNTSDSLSVIGRDYGVSKHTIFNIKKKRSWSWLTKDYNFD